MSAARLTVAVPCRNAGQHLKTMLKSMLAQTEQSFRLLLIDDASTDGSAECARAVCGDRIDIRRNKVALGIAGNWNLCASEVDTEFFCLAHQDDVYLPDFLQRSVAMLEERAGSGMVHSRALAIDADGRPQHSFAERYKEHFWRLPRRTDAEQYSALWAGNYICCPSVVFRTEAYRCVGSFRADLKFALDWEYWFRLARSDWTIADLDEPLVKYRRHDGATTRSATEGQWRFVEELHVLRDARQAGVAAGLLPAETGHSPALRNTLLHEALTDLERGDRASVNRKMSFLREHAPELWRTNSLRAFRTLAALGVVGKTTLQLARHIAVRSALGSRSR